MATTRAHELHHPVRPSRQDGGWTADRLGARALEYAAVLYAIAWVVHTGDHVRRGFGVVTTEVAVLGNVAAVLQLAAVVLVLLRHRLAPLLAALIGIPDAIGIAAVHLLPHWSSFSDAFPGAHHTGVTTFSWFAALFEIASALAFGLAGLYLWRRTRHGVAPAPG